MDHPITSVCGGIRPSRGAAMNLIVIVSDTFRYDYLGANGNRWIKTPELDAFSRRAVNFDRCTISSFPTIPTRTDWFTGRYSFRSEEHTSELQSQSNLVCRLLLEKKNRTLTEYLDWLAIVMRPDSLALIGSLRPA